MTDATSSVARSFRLSPVTSALLDALAEAGPDSRNALADRLLGEALRTEAHPVVRFRAGAAGRREPALVGTRLLVRQVVGSLRAAGGRVDEVADYLGISEQQVRAAASYYADFADEVDADIAWAARQEADLAARWQREQAAFA